MAGNLSLSIDVPRYLFRVFSPGSDGMNDATGFASMAKSNNNFETRSLAQLERPDARNMLKDHVLWQSWRSRSDDLLISFTSSFLFALQHCVRKIATGRDTTRHNCHISIIDTSMFPEGTFTWTVELLKEYHLDEMEHPYLLQMYHEAEYLAQYQLAVIPDAGVTVSFEELVTKGDLFQIAPELEDKAYEKLLWRRLQQLRASWYREEEGITSKHVERALNLALCFGGQWVPLVMMWALATRMRSEHDQILRHQFRDPLHGESDIFVDVP